MSMEDRIHAAINGELNGEELEKFHRDALSNPEMLTKYTEFAWLNGHLESIGEALPPLLSGNDRQIFRPKFRLLPLAFSSIAAALVGALFAGLIVSHNSPEIPYVATIIEAEGCQWAGSDLPTAKGARLQAGTLALTAGMATLKFDSGAQIVIEAPATLEVESSMRCRLIEGSLVAEVPESAHGFTVDAPEMEVVDLGTRFGLTTNQFGKSHVMVFEGEVEVTRAGQNETTNLKTGNTLVNGADLVHPVGEISRDHGLPQREGWFQIEASKDTYVRKGDEWGNFGSSPLMMVKETELSATNRRRGIVSFDLSHLGEKEFDAAELFFDVESSGLGFSTLVPDSRFAIYAVTDDSLDTWEENQLTWDSFPAVNDGGPLPEMTRKLGTFEILRGASAATAVKMESSDLSAYLREDANRIATFLVVRETGEYESQGLVHAFATKEHPTAKAPTLYLKLR